ncbi:MAG: hypothetical protein EHM48_08640 [Planctomycetaceae bacterium]|nr:MAG: hypothetical protein EHM48_08640 [Planctomycetaceae bacterium]
MNIEPPKLDNLSLAAWPAGEKVSCLAWAGWAVLTPSTWRPLGISGGRKKGTLLVGDGRQAVAQFKWLWIKRKKFDPARWIKRRLRRVAQKQYRKQASAAVGVGDFQRLAWLGAGQLKRASRSQTAIWYGYSQAAKLLLEVVINAGAGDDVVRTLRKEVIASLRACPANGPTLWSVFDTSFVSPAGFDVRKKRINLGDVAMEFVSRSRTIIARQVYPAELALQRRGMDKWLSDCPFPQKRRFKAVGEVRDVNVDTLTIPATARCRVGQRRFPFPLRFVCRRHSAAGVVEETGIGRLLMAEYNWPFRRGGSADSGLDVVSWSLGQMNWSSRNVGRKAGKR